MVEILEKEKKILKKTKTTQDYKGITIVNILIF